MKLKLSEIFVPIPNIRFYNAAELNLLDLQQDFIYKISILYQLPFEGIINSHDNLCFAGNKEVRLEYKTSYNKIDILEIILPQTLHQKIDFEIDEVIFPNEVHSFFSTSYKDQIAIKAQKKQLRKVMLTIRNKTSHQERKIHSEKVCEQLWKLMMEKKVQVIHSYLTIGSEINVLPLLQKAIDHNIKVVVPKTLKKRHMLNLELTNLKNMELGIFNTYHPKDGKPYTGNYDLIIVAGLAFNNNGFRIGYGGGYYDTFLANQGTALKVGVCYLFQIKDQIPQEEHDIQLDVVLSEKV